MEQNVTAPVKYTDCLYYIGTRYSPCWLLESTDGVILIDTAMPDDLIDTTTWQLFLRTRREAALAHFEKN